MEGSRAVVVRRRPHAMAQGRWQGKQAFGGARPAAARSSVALRRHRVERKHYATGELEFRASRFHHGAGEYELAPGEFAITRPRASRRLPAAGLLPSLAWSQRSS